MLGNERRVGVNDFGGQAANLDSRRHRLRRRSRLTAKASAALLR